jgi:tetratricopeptide (TPR) repeat protein
VRWPYLRALLVVPHDPVTGVAHLRRAVDLAPPDEDSPRLRLAEVLLGQGEADEAEQHFRDVLEQGRDSPRVQFGLGRAAYAKGNVQGSLPHLQRAVTHPPIQKSAAALLAAAYHRLGQSEAAAAARRQEAAAAEPIFWFDALANEVEELSLARSKRVERATRLVKSGRVAQGLQELRHLVRDYPDAASYRHLGHSLLWTGDAAGAAEALQQAVALNARCVDSHFFLGIARFRLAEARRWPSAEQGQAGLEAAAQCFLKVLELQAHHGGALANLGQCRRLQQKPDAALAAYRAAVRCQPDQAPFHLALAELLAEQGRPAEALVHLRDALSVGTVPTLPPVLARLLTEPTLSPD